MEFDFTDPLTLIVAVGIGALVLTIAATFYLNSVRDDSSKRLVQLLAPFDVSFDTYKKSTFATGTIGDTRGTINMVKEARGQFLAKMRIRFEMEGLPHFSLSTKRTVTFLSKNAHEHAEKWPIIADHFYVLAGDASVAAEQIVEALSPKTREHIDDFERKYEGILVYTADGTLFKKLDKDLLNAVPDINGELVLLTHFFIKKNEPSKLFHDFVNDSVKLMHELQADLKPFAKAVEEGAHKRHLTIKTNTPEAKA